MKALGRMIYSMDLAFILSLMVINGRDSLKRVLLLE
jgi:hypothetical protein